MNKPNDYKKREEALNIEQSYLIQAPAGSGKTHLLISRYLKSLLTIDDSTDEVLAITFTNKAAQEMRDRVLSLLNKTSDITCSNELNEQEKLAFEVNKLDKAKSLNLRNNPNSIRIMTIDALCNNIIQTSNVSSASSFNYKINSKPYEMYEESVIELLSSYNDKPWSNSIITVLEYLNNNYNRLIDLLIELLQTRDIWLPYVLSESDPKKNLEKLEKNLTDRTTEMVNYAINTIPEKNIFEIETCLNIYLSSLKLDPIKLDSESLKQTSTWIHLCNLILTKQNKVRKTVTKDLGITAPSSVKNLDDKQKLKQQKELMQNMFYEVGINKNFISALCMLRNSPPSKYTEDQAKILSSLLTLLPVAVAYLSITFKNKNNCDFTEVGIKCNELLGSKGQPSDHCLKTSEKLKHILVDEFQDTSLIQLNLLKKLIICWEENDHKTLFFVGDPMQSIYKFRQADVAIFTSLINKNLLNIKLNYINLSCNFRSSATVVNWVNNVFSQLFNKNYLPNSGNVPFNEAIAVKSLNEEKVKLTILDPKDKPHQNKVIVDIVKEIINAKEQSIAVLTRSRSHLKQLAHELNSNGISVISQDMEPLHKTYEIIDIANLSLALNNPLDKISWLALLSSPWIGLSNKTIHTIANYDKKLSIYSIISTQDIEIDKECKLRLSYVLPIIINAVKSYGTSCPARHLEKTWLQLGGAELIKDKNIAATIDNLFNTLHQDNSLPNSWYKWQQLLSSSYVKATPTPGQHIHLLTIHKAKGLEFDHVILPSFNEKPNTNKSKLLNWHNSINKELDLVLGPIPKNIDDNSKIHNYLKQLDKIQTKNENLRVLYVAVTRAKLSINIVGAANIDEQINNNSFFAETWGLIKNDKNTKINVIKQVNLIDTHSKDIAMKSKILSTDTLKLLNKNIISNSKPQPLIFNILSDNKKIILGKIIHSYIEKIANLNIEIEHLNLNVICKNLYVELKEHGISKHEALSFKEKTLDILAKCINDKRLQYILDIKHTDARNEYSVATVENSIIKRHIIDRTHIDSDDVRWIIDYKTTSSPMDDISCFYESEQKKHSLQLERYAQIFNQENRKIMLAIYYPLFGGYFEWEYKSNLSTTSRL